MCCHWSEVFAAWPFYHCSALVAFILDSPLRLCFHKHILTWSTDVMQCPSVWYCTRIVIINVIIHLWNVNENLSSCRLPKTLWMDNICSSCCEMFCRPRSPIIFCLSGSTMSSMGGVLGLLISSNQILFLHVRGMSGIVLWKKNHILSWKQLPGNFKFQTWNKLC